LIILDDVKQNKKFSELIFKANEYLGIIGYTEHGDRHCSLAASIAHNIMIRLGKNERQAQLAAIAGYLHDIGNVINRDYHAQTAAVMVIPVLVEMGMEYKEVIEIAAAIGNHDERDGSPISDICASIILADKSDVHQSRVRTTEFLKKDIHDRVNWAAKSSFLRVDDIKKRISLEIKIDTSISSVVEYFEIFLSRMTVCRHAAEFLGCKFELEINGTKLT